MQSAKNKFKEKAASIIIRTYNSETTIEDALMSALNQDFPATDYEVVMIDDGSSDGTVALIERFRGRDSRLVAVYRDHQGAGAAANRGIEVSAGRYIAFLDSDDLFEQDYLSMMLREATTHSGYDFYYPNYWERIRQEQTLVVPKNIYENVMIGILFDRRKLVDAGCFREGLLFPEYDLLLRTRKNWKGFHVSSLLFTFQRRRESLSGDDARVQKGIEDLKRLHPDAETEIKLIRGYAF